VLQARAGCEEPALAAEGRSCSLGHKKTLLRQSSRPCIYPIRRPDAGWGFAFQLRDGKLPIAPTLRNDRPEAAIHGLVG